MTLLVFGSIRSTLPSFSHRTQTELSPNATARGPAETSMRLSTRLVAGSMRKTRFSAGHVTHREVSPNATLLQPAGSLSSPTTLFSTGSMRDKVVLVSVIIHTLSGVA